MVVLQIQPQRRQISHFPSALFFMDDVLDPRDLSRGFFLPPGLIYLCIYMEPWHHNSNGPYEIFPKRQSLGARRWVERCYSRGDFVQTDEER